MRRAALVTVAALVVLLAGPAPARADVSVLPTSLPTATAGARFTVSVVDEDPDAQANKLELVFPGSLDVTRVYGPSDWSPVQTDATTFTLTGPPRAGRIDVEVWLGKTPTFPGTVVVKVLATYTDGDVVRWIEFPDGEHKAGVLTVTAAAAVPSSAGPATTTPAAGDAEPGSSALPWMAGGGVALLVALAAVLLLVRRRNRPSAPPLAVSAPPAHAAPAAAPATSPAVTAPPAPEPATGPPAAAATRAPAPAAVTAPPAPPVEAAEPRLETAPPPAPSAEAAAPAVTPAATAEPRPQAAPPPVTATADGDGPLLAVDYGTSNTVALLRSGDGRVRPLLFDSSPLLPSAVQDVDGRLVTGRDALNAARADPGAHEQNPKRRINDLSVLLGGREHEVADLLAATLRRVVEEAERVTGAGVAAGTVLTHPAAWGAIRRETLLDAATRAGPAAPVLVPEPVAAAAYFAEVLGNDLAPGRCVVVYDLGAGTFDVTVVRRDPEGGLEILAADGLDDLGGLDFDALLVDMIGTQAGAVAEGWQGLLRPRSAAERRFARLLWDDARGAKETLSRLAAASVSVPSLDLDAHLTREQFEAAARPLLARTIRATAAVMRAARVPQDDVAGLFLVGGSTRVPLVATLLFQELKVRPIVLEQPEIVVAEGALRCAQRAGRWVAR